METAFKELAGKDQRPLLILRECLVCNGTDEALLKAQADNEKTLLMMRWFHCVKLPVDVMTKEDHPFHALFSGDSPPHLLVADFDGKNIRPLESERSRTELWDVLGEAVTRNYTMDSGKSLKSLAKLLDRFDRIDEKIVTLKSNLEQTIEKKGPDNSKVKKLQKKIAGAEKEKAEMLESFKKSSDIKLIKREVDSPTEGEAVGSAG